MFISTKKSFKLRYEETRNGIKWYTLQNDLVYQYKKETFIVPAELFFTDVASTPKWLRKLSNFFSPLGKVSRPSVLHDFIVGEKHLSYFEKHYIYYLALREENVTRFKASVFFLGVYSFYWLCRLKGNEF
jgi:hypothetical protein